MAFHAYNDGRGSRRVIADGVELKGCRWCDTDTGDYECLEYPIRIVNGEEAACYVGHAKQITVEYL